MDWSRYQSGRDTDQHTAMASRRLLVSAYDAWLKANGRAKRSGEPSPEKHSNQIFIQELRALLNLARDDQPRRLGIPTSRSGWSNWRNGRGTLLVKLRLDVCRAIKTISGVDVTANQSLSGEPTNSTDLVTIGAVKYRAEPNASPTHSILVETISFRASDPKEVRLADFNPTSHSPGQRIGSVRFALTGASIFMDAQNSLSATLRHLSDGEPTDCGHVRGAHVSLDDEGVLRWRVQPPFPKEVLQARLEDLRLCSGVIEESVKPTVGVSVEGAEILVQLTFDDTIKATQREHSDTKRRLVEKILKNKLLDNGPRSRFVLSQASVAVE